MHSITHNKNYSYLPSPKDSSNYAEMYLEGTGGLVPNFERASGVRMVEF